MSLAIYEAIRNQDSESMILTVNGGSSSIKFADRISRAEASLCQCGGSFPTTACRRFSIAIDVIDRVSKLQITGAHTRAGPPIQMGGAYSD